MNNDDYYFNVKEIFDLPPLEEIEKIEKEVIEMIDTKKKAIRRFNDKYLKKISTILPSKKRILQKDVIELNDSVKEIEQDISEDMKVIKNTKRLVEEKDISKRIDLIPRISFEDDEYLEQLQYIFSDMGLSDDTRYDQAYKNTCNAAYEVRPHQRIIYTLASPSIKNNFLVYHDMGTGKTCALVQSILSLALYYYQKSFKNEDGPPPGILLLNQDDKQRELYINEIIKGCYYFGITPTDKKSVPNSNNTYMKMDVDEQNSFFCEGEMNGEYIKFHKTPYESGDDTYPSENPNLLEEGETRMDKNGVVYRVKALRNSKIWKKQSSIFLFVKISKMTKKIYATPKIIDDIFDRDNGYIPKRGAILIDEAHNFINPKNMNTLKNINSNESSAYFNYRKAIFDCDIKKIFFTGTPSNDFSINGTQDIFNLINFLAPQKFENSYTVLNGKKIEKKNWFKFNDFFDEEKNIRTPKRRELIAKMKSIVSYFTYRFDYSIYPEMRVNLFIDRVKKSFTNDKNLSMKYNSMTGDFENFEESDGEPAVVYVNTEMTKSMSKVKFPFQTTKKNPTIPKHEAICKLVVMNPNRKHFFFMDMNTAPQSGVYNFATQIFPKLVDKYYNATTKRNKILIKFGLFWKIDFKNGGENAFVNALSQYIKYIKSKVSKINPKMECEFYCVLESNERIIKMDKESRFTLPPTYKFTFDSFQIFLEKNPELQNNDKFMIVENRRTMNHPLKMFKIIYNHIENKQGHIVKYVFGMNDSREGLDLFTTSFVHFLKPPESISVFQQASARAARFCSFARYYPKKEIPHTYTPIIYFDTYVESNPSSDTETFWMKQYNDKEKIKNGEQSPTEKVLELFQKNSIDCNLHSQRTKTECQSKIVFKNLGKTCVSPYNGSIINFKFFPSFRSCYTRNLIPISTKFTEWHYALFLLFQKHDVTPKSLEGRFNHLAEVASDLINKYYKVNKITLNGMISSIQYIYYIFLKNKNTENLKYFKAIQYILNIQFNRLTNSEKQQFEQNQSTRDFVDILFEKGRKLQIIENSKEIPKKLKKDLNEISILLLSKKYNLILENANIKKIQTSKTRSGKTFKGLGNLRNRK